MDNDVVMESPPSTLWQYVVTAQRPTSIGRAIKCRLGGSDDQHLVVSKGTRLEVYAFAEEGLKLLLDMPVFGRIAALQSYTPKDRGELILLLTERFNLCILSWDPQTRTFVTEATGSVEERGAMPAESGQIAITDPAGQDVLLHLYQGMVQIIPIATDYSSRDRKYLLPKEGSGAKGKRNATMRPGDPFEPFTVSIEELAVVNMAFLRSPTSDSLLAVLHQDVRENRHLRTYFVSHKEKKLKDGPIRSTNVEQGASLLIPVPEPYRGVVVIGEQTATYIGEKKTNPISINFKITVMTCWGILDKDSKSLRFLLGDRYGTVYVLFLSSNESDITGMKLESLGEASAPTCLVYLDNGHVFVGSHYGDSQLIKLRTEKNTDGQLLDILDTYTNLAPISDFAVMDLEKQGQGQIVACCGGFKDGTLRIVRNGVGINEIAGFDMPGLKNVWSLRANSSAAHDSILVLSFVSGTQMLQIEGGELSEMTIEGFDLDEATLYCGNVSNNLFVQVSPKRVVLVDASSKQRVHEWRPSDPLSRITVARANADQILCAEGNNRKLHYLEVQGRQLVHAGSTTLPQEIACVDLMDKSAGTSQLCAIGMWTTDESVAIHRLPTLERVAAQKLDGDFFPRSVAITSFDGVDHLLVGQGDGRLYDFTMDSIGDEVSLRDKRVVALGTQPITLTSFEAVGGQRNVFAGCDRPTVIYSNKRKMLYSQVNLKEVSNMCSFNSEEFPHAMAVISEEQLKIGTIDQIQKLHIRTVHLHEMARRIAHQEQSKTFGVLTVKLQRDDKGDEHESAYVKLMDDQTFEVLDSLRMHPTELSLSIMSFQIAGTDERPATTVYIVGTAFADPAEDEVHKGRIMVFEVSSNKTLRLLAQTEVQGAVYALAPLDGHFAAGINNKVYVFRLDMSDDGSSTLTQVCGHHGLVVVVSLVSRGPYLLVADLMKSVSVLMWKSEEGLLEQVGRDADTNWMTAAEMLDDDVYLGADNCFNLFTVRRNTGATRDEERRRLESLGEMHLGGQVNKFQRGSLVMSLPENQVAARPNLLYATTEGMIGAVLNIDQSTFNNLEKLQNSIAKNVKSLGQFDHSSWRTFKNEKRAVAMHHFIDGDLVESFLDLLPEQQEAVVADMGDEYDVAQFVKLVEELSRAH